MKTAAKIALLATALATVPWRVAADEWTKTDTAFQLTVAALQITDLMQTRWFLTNRDCRPVGPAACAPYHHDEINPLLGDHPSRLRLDASVVAAIAGHAAISYLLPQPWRRIWQTLGITVEVAVVSNNVSAVAGFKLALP